MDGAAADRGIGAARDGDAMRAHILEQQVAKFLGAIACQFPGSHQFAGQRPGQARRMRDLDHDLFLRTGVTTHDKKSMPQQPACASRGSRESACRAWYVISFAFPIMPLHSLSRRGFFALTAAAPIASAFAQGKSVPVGLELFSVRGELKKDLMGTVRAVAKMGYDCVEFFSPYYAWTPDYAKQVRR